MELNQIKGSFAGEIVGLDIAKPISPATVDAIEAAMAKHAVVVVRAQEPRDEDLIRFSRCFGGLELPRSGGYFDGSHKRIARELFDAGNLNVDGDIQAEDDPARRFGKGNALWHTDSSFNALPTKWSLLMGYVIPPEGGQTHFVDTRQAYEQLDDAMKARIQDYRVVHSLWHSRAKGGFNASQSEQVRVPEVVHPLVMTSASGRPALYMGAHARDIVGLPDGEGRQLLDALLALATREANIYAHDWRPGDLVIWDNRCTLHRSGPFDSFRFKRDMRRTTILEILQDVDGTRATQAT